MARVEFPVDKAKLVAIVKQVESKGEISGGRVKLYSLVSDEYNKQVKGAKPITPSVVGLRITKWSIPIITKPGKKGRAAGSVSGPRGPIHRTPKAEKFQASAEMKTSLEEIRKVTPERFLPLWEKMVKGSRSAGVKHKCLECSGWQTSEVRRCQVNNCGLWPFRPYQGALDANEIEEIEENEEIEEMDEVA